MYVYLTAGRSTQHLAAQHPDHFVIGVEKFRARLRRTAAFRDYAPPLLDSQLSGSESLRVVNPAEGVLSPLESPSQAQPREADVEDAPRGPPAAASSPNLSSATNMVLVCGNCEDLWRLLWESGVQTRNPKPETQTPNPKP